jgi:hypothetical protein
VHHYLPRGEARRAQQVAARLYPNVLVVLRADLAQLERGAHLTVQLVLFLRNLPTPTQVRTSSYTNLPFIILPLISGVFNVIKHFHSVQNLVQ